MEARGQIPVGPPVPNPPPSYWQASSSSLAEVIEPKTKKDPQRYDYVIVGSGISGTAIAYNLLKMAPSCRIMMLEARGACSGATGRNGGHTKPSIYRNYLQHREKFGKEEALKIARMQHANVLETHKLADALGIDCESHLCNTVDIVYDQQTFDDGCASIEAIRNDAEYTELQRGCMADYKIYTDVEEVEREFWIPGRNANSDIEEESVVGAFEYLAGRISAYHFTIGLLNECIKRGLDLRTDTPVHKFLPTCGVHGASDQRYNVFTQHGVISTRSVIMATNAYTPYLLPSLQGVIVPQRGQITAQKPRRSNKFPRILPTTYSFIYKTGYEYMIPRPLPEGGQHIIIGGGLGRQSDAAKEFGTVDDKSLNLNISKYLRGSLVGYFGASNWGVDHSPDDDLLHEWSGIIGVTGDGQPLVGKMPGEGGLWMSAGFNGYGMVMCLKSAEALVHMIMSGSKHEEIDWFPKSFLVSQERIDQGVFKGRKDIQALEAV